MPTEPTLLARLSDDLAALVERLSPRLVSVFARRGRPSNGFVFDDGLVLTPAHAVELPDHIAVRTLDGARREASLAGRDDTTNVAVLRVPGLVAERAPVAAAVRPGQLLVALARHPSGGVLSALVTAQAAGGPLKGWRGQAYDRIVRLDRALPSTFAGTAIVDAGGQLAAIGLAGELRAAGLAAEAAALVDLASTVARDGSIARGYLGVMCQATRLAAPQRDAAGVQAGLLVVGLADEGAAAAAGILPGDLLVRFDGDVLGDADALHARLMRERAGASHQVTLLRGAATMTLDVVLGAREPRA